MGNVPQKVGHDVCMHHLHHLAAGSHAQGLMAAGLLGPFNKVVNPPGQAETNFGRFLDFKPTQTPFNAAYPIQPAHAKFEPW